MHVDSSGTIDPRGGRTENEPTPRRVAGGPHAYIPSEKHQLRYVKVGMCIKWIS